MNPKAGLALPLLVAVPLLSGCVAAIPIVAATAMGGSNVIRGDDEETKVAAAEGRVTIDQPPARSVPAPAPTSAPAPTPAPTPAPAAARDSFAVNDTAPGTSTRRSGLLDTGGSQQLSVAPAAAELGAGATNSPTGAASLGRGGSVFDADTAAAAPGLDDESGDVMRFEDDAGEAPGFVSLAGSDNPEAVDIPGDVPASSGIGSGPVSALTPGGFVRATVPVETPVADRASAVPPPRRPDPSGSTPGGAIPASRPGASFASLGEFVRSRAQARAAGRQLASVVPVPFVDLARPEFIACDDKPLAMIVDLDPDGMSGAAFEALWSDPDGEPFDAELQRAVAAARDAGVKVFYLSDQPYARAPRIQASLNRANMGPAAPAETLLLATGGEEASKEERRRAVAENFCVIAIAGDRRGDFAELYDYLRDPDTPAVRTLDPLYGAGWFLTPSPIDR